MFEQRPELPSHAPGLVRMWVKYAAKALRSERPGAWEGNPASGLAAWTTQVPCAWCTVGAGHTFVHLSQLLSVASLIESL